jgi:adenosylcobinamide-phosphate synthase
LLYGALVVAIGVAGAGSGAALLLHVVGQTSEIAAVFAGALLLKASFSYRQLEEAALAVAGHLDAGDLLAARASLGALVSRDAVDLCPALVASAAVESVAENLSDSFVAPILYSLCFGAPGALAYRAINTLDAMVGYHGRYEYLGRAAARLDDVASFVPARLTALLLAAGSIFSGASPVQVASSASREHGRTESPNAGWPMATMAGALAVRLEKVGHYRLGDGGSPCTAAAIRRAVRLARWGAALFVVAAVGVNVGLGALAGS